MRRPSSSFSEPHAQQKGPLQRRAMHHLCFTSRNRGVFPPNEHEGGRRADRCAQGQVQAGVVDRLLVRLGKCGRGMRSAFGKLAFWCFSDLFHSKLGTNRA